MKVLKSPKPETWPELCLRPSSSNDELAGRVREIISAVKENGDSALRDFSQKFDSVELEQIPLELPPLAELQSKLGDELCQAIALAVKNVRKFHSAQSYERLSVETTSGVNCWREARPIEKVGLYIPGGTAPLFSTLVMLGVPATLAECGEIVVCSPPPICNEIAYVCRLLGIHQIFQVGGAQAVAAMGLGTESVPKVDKIFGPGNQYVTQAKQMLSAEGLAIDMPAGPSEVLVIADDKASPEFVAADLLSQAEHGPDSQVVLTCLSEEFAEKVKTEVDSQLASLGRADIAKAALKNSLALVFGSVEQCIAFSNSYAPEHLILQTEQCEDQAAGAILDQITSAGSVFVGALTPESCGDYASGTNHTLPTAGFARAWSGVSLESFQKKITFQQISSEGLKAIGPAVETMAKAEGLDAHSNAVSLRLRRIVSPNSEAENE